MTMTRRWKGIGTETAAVVLAGLFLVSSAVSPRAQAPAEADWIGTAASLPAEGFVRPSGDWRLDLPHDHGTHPETFSESWQMVAHLQGQGGEPVGIQFSLFRIGLLPPDAPGTEAWQPHHLYRGHVIVTDTAANAVFAEERFGRGIEGLAGFDVERHELRLDNWSIEFVAEEQNGVWRLNASAGDARAALDLRPAKEPLSVDPEEAPFRGYAVSRFDVEGMLETPEGEQAVTGAAWFDHLWGELPIPGGAPVASDRLQVQLDDGTELAVIRSRRVDGGGTPTIDALLIGADGQARPLGEDGARIELTRHWQGGEAAWPVGWTLWLDDLELIVTPVVDDQEHGFMTPLWSGLVRADGRRGEEELTGMGTLQLTGHGLP